MTRSVRYQLILHTLYYTLHTEHAYCLSYRFLNNAVITTVIEMVEILDGRLGKRSVEQVRYVINNLLHLVIVKYGDISLVLCISTRLRLVTILSLLVKYLVILHADPCNKSYIHTDTNLITLPCSLARAGNNHLCTQCTFSQSLSHIRLQYLLQSDREIIYHVSQQTMYFIISSYRLHHCACSDIYNRYRDFSHLFHTSISGCGP